MLEELFSQVINLFFSLHWALAHFGIVLCGESVTDMKAWLFTSRSGLARQRFDRYP